MESRIEKSREQRVKQNRLEDSFEKNNRKVKEEFEKQISVKEVVIESKRENRETQNKALQLEQKQSDIFSGISGK